MHLGEVVLGEGIVRLQHASEVASVVQDIRLVIVQVGNCRSGAHLLIDLLVHCIGGRLWSHSVGLVVLHVVDQVPRDVRLMGSQDTLLRLIRLLDVLELLP